MEWARENLVPFLRIIFKNPEMNRRYYIRITPDYDILYDDMKGCSYSAYGDEVYNSEPSLGPLFRCAVPGIEEWLKRYEDSTSFAETSTSSDFDWKSWHWEGLQFAKFIRDGLPRCYDLYYNPPYEDKSGTLHGEILIDDTIDKRISSLGNCSSFTGKPCSRKDNVKIEIENKNDNLHITLRIGLLTTTFHVSTDNIKSIKLWLENMAKGEDTSECYLFGDKNLFFFPQKIGIHPEMGTLWVMKSYNSEIEFSAYINRQEFVKAFYSILLTKLGFGIYDSIDDYPTGENRREIWRPYNEFKSALLEHYIATGQIIEKTEQNYYVNETFVMFADYGGCCLWDTMGVGSGDSELLLSDFGEFPINVSGLKKWSLFFDNRDANQTYAEYWEEGWQFAQELRKQLPDNLDLFYMCYDPERPHDYVGFDCRLPRLVVPRGQITEKII